MGASAEVVAEEGRFFNVGDEFVKFVILLFLYVLLRLFPDGGNLVCPLSTDEYRKADKVRVFFNDGLYLNLVGILFFLLFQVDNNVGATLLPIDFR